MNARTLLLILSLLGNAALLAAYLRLPARPPAGNSLPEASAALATTTGPASAVAAGQARQVTAAIVRAGFSWAAIETNDLGEFARRLKAAGFSRAEVRTILFDRMERDSPWRAATKTPYWQSTQINSPDPKAAQENAKRMAEYMKLQQQFLSPEDYEDPDYVDAVRRRWGNLPVEKIKALSVIEADYENLNMEEYARSRARPGEESNRLETYHLIQKEKLADIAKALTPEEFADYELRASHSANVLRTQLTSFQPSEAEYRAIFAMQKEIQDQLVAAELRRDRAAYDALKNEMTAKVKALLGDERGLDYEASIVGNDQTARILTRLGLPARVATEVRQAQQDYTKRATEIRANTALSAADRSARLNALVRQAEKQLTDRLGATGFEAYSDLKGEWLRAMKPKDGPGGP